MQIFPSLVSQRQRQIHSNGDYSWRGTLPLCRQSTTATSSITTYGVDARVESRQDDRRRGSAQSVVNSPFRQPRPRDFLLKRLHRPPNFPNFPRLRWKHLPSCRFPPFLGLVPHHVSSSHIYPDTEFITGLVELGLSTLLRSTPCSHDCPLIAHESN